MTKYQKQPGDSKWRNQRINATFMAELRKEFVGGTFTNEQAYRLYYERCWTKLGDACTRYERAMSEECKADSMHALLYDACLGDDFMRMNVRNNLCAAAYRGILVRRGRGEYSFFETGYEAASGVWIIEVRAKTEDALLVRTTRGDLWEVGKEDTDVWEALGFDIKA